MKMKPSCAVEIYTTNISPSFFVHKILEDLNVCWKNMLQCIPKKYQSTTVRQRNTRYRFVHSSLLFLRTLFPYFTLVHFSCCIFSRCALFMLHSFIFQVSCVALFTCSTLWCCNNSMLQRSSCCTIFMLNLFHVEPSC